MGGATVFNAPIFVRFSNIHSGGFVMSVFSLAIRFLFFLGFACAYGWAHVVSSCRDDVSFVYLLMRDEGKSG